MIAINDPLLPIYLQFLISDPFHSALALKSSASVPGHALFPTFLALATILATPTIPSDSTSYTYNLIAMHLLLAVPVVAPLFVREKRDRRNEGAILDVFAVYLLLALLTFGYHVYTSITLLYASYWNPAALVASLIRGFSLNHAQSSIASDAVFAAVATLLYIRANNPDKWTKQKVFWIANMVMLGPAVVLPMWFAMTRVELSKKVAEKPVDESKSPSRQEKRKVKKTG